MSSRSRWKNRGPEAGPRLLGSIRTRIAVAAVTGAVVLTAAVISSAPGLAAPRHKPQPTATPCESTETFGLVQHCVTTVNAVADGRHPAGTAVALPGSWVLEVTGDQVKLGRTECPGDMYCGAILAMLSADFPHAQSLPAVDDVIDVFGTVTPDDGVFVRAWR